MKNRILLVLAGIVAVVLVGMYITIGNIQEQRDEQKAAKIAAETRANEYAEALRVYQEAAKRKLDAVEAERLAEQKRAETLEDKLEAINADDEKITCQVPNVIRSVFGGMQRK